MHSFHYFFEEYNRDSLRAELVLIGDFSFNCHSYHVSSHPLEDKPRVLQTRGNVTIFAGNKLELMCVADANPRPSYQWRHKGVVLPNKDKNTLLIDSATADNAGVYECVISNTQGQASAVMSIEVKGELDAETSFTCFITAFLFRFQCTKAERLISF